jgi:hypothetical protein
MSAAPPPPSLGAEVAAGEVADGDGEGDGATARTSKLAELLLDSRSELRIQL